MNINLGDGEMKRIASTFGARVKDVLRRTLEERERMRESPGELELVKVRTAMGDQLYMSVVGIGVVASW